MPISAITIMMMTLRRLGLRYLGTPEGAAAGGGAGAGAASVGGGGLTFSGALSSCGGWVDMGGLIGARRCQASARKGEVSARGVCAIA